MQFQLPADHCYWSENFQCNTDAPHCIWISMKMHLLY